MSAEPREPQSRLTLYPRSGQWGWLETDTKQAIEAYLDIQAAMAEQREGTLSMLHPEGTFTVPYRSIAGVRLETVAPEVSDVD